MKSVSRRAERSHSGLMMNGLGWDGRVMKAVIKATRRRVHLALSWATPRLHHRARRAVTVSDRNLEKEPRMIEIWAGGLKAMYWIGVSVREEVLLMVGVPIIASAHTPSNDSSDELILTYQPSSRVKYHTHPCSSYHILPPLNHDMYGISDADCLQKVMKSQLL